MSRIEPLSDLAHPLHLWVFTEHRNATCFINFEYPLQHWIKTGAVQLHLWASSDFASPSSANSSADSSAASWTDIAADLEQRCASHRPDAVILSRYVQPHARELLALFARLGVPTSCHLDDLLFELPADLGAHYSATYSSSYLQNLHDCMAAADQILASTETLAEALRARLPGKTVKTVLGVCYLPELIARRHTARLARRFNCLLQRRLRHPGAVVIGYMGSSSHARDLLTIAPQIEALLHQYPRLHFETLGLALPQRLLQFGTRVRTFGYTRSYAEFLGRLYERAWDIGLAPLVDDGFNRSKTFTKFVEYTSCDIPVLATGITPYRELAEATGALACPAGDDWSQAIRDWLDDPAARRHTLAVARQLCAQRYAPRAAGERLLQCVVASTRA